MSIETYCTSCEKTFFSDDESNRVCPNCGAITQEDNIREVYDPDRNFPPKPFFLRVLSVLLGFSIFIYAVSLFFVGLSLLTGNAKNDTLSLLAIAILVFDILFAMSALWAIRNNKTWSRHIFPLSYASALVPFVYSSGFSLDQMVRYFIYAFLTLWICWYFYQKKNVVQYYRELDRINRKLKTATETEAPFPT